MNNSNGKVIKLNSNGKVISLMALVGTAHWHLFAWYNVWWSVLTFVLTELNKNKLWSDYHYTALTDSVVWNPTSFYVCLFISLTAAGVKSGSTTLHRSCTSWRPSHCRRRRIHHFIIERTGDSSDLSPPHVRTGWTLQQRTAAASPRLPWWPTSISFNKQSKQEFHFYFIFLCPEMCLKTFLSFNPIQIELNWID